MKEITVIDKTSCEHKQMKMWIKENKFSIEIIIPQVLHVSINRTDWERINGMAEIKKREALLNLKENSCYSKLKNNTGLSR